MRIGMLIVAAAVLMLAACGGEKQPPSVSQATPIPSPDTRLIIIDLKQLPLDESKMLAGTWKATDGALATGQYTRRFERDASDPALAAGTLRVDILARLHESVANANEDFGQICSGPGGLGYVQSAIVPRGFTPAEIRVSQPELAPLGADEQAFWRAEYGKPGSERLVTYYLCVRVRNTRVILSTIAPMRDGAEPANLLAETTEAGKRQVAHLQDILQKMPPAPPARPPRERH